VIESQSSGHFSREMEITKVVANLKNVKAERCTHVIRGGEWKTKTEGKGGGGK
jgi:hypothetical protein